MAAPTINSNSTQQFLRRALLGAMATAAAVLVIPIRHADAKNTPPAATVQSQGQTFSVYTAGKTGNANLAVRLMPNSEATGGMVPQVLQDGHIMQMPDGSPAWKLVDGQKFVAPNGMIVRMEHMNDHPNTIRFNPAASPEVEKLVHSGSQPGPVDKTFGGKFPNGVAGAMEPIISKGDKGFQGDMPNFGGGAPHHPTINPAQQGLNYLERSMGGEGAPLHNSHFKFNNINCEVTPTGPNTADVQYGKQKFGLKNIGGVLTVDNDKFSGAFINGKFHVADKTTATVTASAEATAFAKTAQQIVIATGRHFASNVFSFGSVYAPENIIVEDYQGGFVPAVEKQIEIIKIEKEKIKVGVHKGGKGCVDDCCEQEVRQQMITNRLLAAMIGDRKGEPIDQVLNKITAEVDAELAQQHKTQPGAVVSPAPTQAAPPSPAATPPLPTPPPPVAAPRLPRAETTPPAATSVAATPAKPLNLYTAYKGSDAAINTNLGRFEVAKVNKSEFHFVHYNDDTAGTIQLKDGAFVVEFTRNGKLDLSDQNAVTQASAALAKVTSSAFHLKLPSDVIVLAKASSTDAQPAQIATISGWSEQVPEALLTKPEIQQRQITQLQKQVGNLQSELTQAGETHTADQETIKKLTGQLDAANAALTLAMQNLASADQRHTADESANAQLQQALTDIRGQLVTARDQIGILQQQNTALNQENGQLLHDIGVAQSDRGSAQTENDNLRQDNASLVAREKALHDKYCTTDVHNAEPECQPLQLKKSELLSPNPIQPTKFAALGNQRAGFQNAMFVTEAPQRGAQSFVRAANLAGDNVVSIEAARHNRMSAAVAASTQTGSAKQAVEAKNTPSETQVVQVAANTNIAGLGTTGGSLPAAGVVGSVAATTRPSGFFRSLFRSAARAITVAKKIVRTFKNVFMALFDRAPKQQVAPVVAHSDNGANVVEIRGARPRDAVQRGQVAEVLRPAA